MLTVWPVNSVSSASEITLVLQNLEQTCHCRHATTKRMLSDANYKISEQTLSLIIDWAKWKVINTDRAVNTFPCHCRWERSVKHIMGKSTSTLEAKTCNYGRWQTRSAREISSYWNTQWMSLVHVKRIGSSGLGLMSNCSTNNRNKQFNCLFFACIINQTGLILTTHPHAQNNTSSRTRYSRWRLREMLMVLSSVKLLALGNLAHLSWVAAGESPMWIQHTVSWA